MSFIKLTRTDGESILLNVNHMAIVGERNGNTSIQMVKMGDGALYSISVTESIDEVYDIIKKTEDPRYRGKK